MRAPPPGPKLGDGGEAEVFALDDGRVLRRFRSTAADVDARIALVEEVTRAAEGTGIVVPEVLDRCVDGAGLPCTIERRLPGRELTVALGEVDGPVRARLLDSYLDTAWRLRHLRCERTEFGELIAEPPLRRETWRAYLRDVLDRQLDHVDMDQARRDIPELDRHLRELYDELGSVPEPAPSLVHFDYFPGNVLCEGDTITSVIDWSVLAIVGDPDLDVALAAAYLGVCATVRPEDHVHASAWLAERELRDRSDLYRRFGATWWLPVTEDPVIRPWIIRQLAGP